MSNKWPTLQKTPIILAIAEMTFDMPEGIDISIVKKNDSDIRKYFKIRKDNLTGNINMPAPIIGEGTVRFSSKYEGFTYQTEDGSELVDISLGRINYKLNSCYQTWADFKGKVLAAFSLFDFYLKDATVKRISIRFINNIKFKIAIENPTAYFNVFLSSTEDAIKYPVSSCSFRYSMVYDPKIRVHVAHSLEEKQAQEDVTNYILDIDVLSFVDEFTYSCLDKQLEQLHDIGNETFFNAITSKTMDLL